MEENAVAVAESDIKKVELSNDQRQMIFQHLLSTLKQGKLPIGTISETAQMFKVSTKTISRIWHRSKEGPVDSPANVSSKKNGRVGRKKKDLDIGRRIQEIPLRRRKNLRSIAAELNISKSTLHRRYQDKEFRAHSSALKPSLTDNNKLQRIQFALSNINLNATPYRFSSMYQDVHVDEKWFYMTETNGRFSMMLHSSLLLHRMGLIFD